MTLYIPSVWPIKVFTTILEDKSINLAVQSYDPVNKNWLHLERDNDKIDLLWSISYSSIKLPEIISKTEIKL